MNPSWRRNYLRYKSFFLNVLGRYRERSDIRAYLEILLSLTTISVFSIFALRPTLLTIAELIKDIQGKQTTIETMDEKIQNIARAQGLFDQSREGISLLYLSVPRGPESDVFARQIEGLGGKHQVQVLNFSMGEAVILGRAVTSEETAAAFSQGANSLPFVVGTLVTIENYPSFSDFYKELQGLRRPPLVENVRLVVTEQETTKQKVVRTFVDGKLPYFPGSSNTK